MSGSIKNASHHPYHADPVSIVGSVRDAGGTAFTIEHKQQLLKVKLDAGTELLDGDKTLDIALEEAVKKGVKVHIIGLLNKKVSEIRALRLYIFHKEFNG
ncbi:hypothetical protein ACFQPF_04840 [Fictibacillus iocasae]|uniref:Uncharacterized protein n=1 Tax=Fictibacillus iocasae TaxID=2715437 RepID=A0ABW2NNW5_9BACL